MLITKESQEALVHNYIKAKHNTDECIGFIDGVHETMKLIERIYKEREKSKPKQETLEEASWKVIGTKDDAFYNGAKWQQERMYSEEDMRLAINKARDISDGKDCFDAEDISGCTEVCTYDWKFNMSEDSIIEQFKKKKNENLHSNLSDNS